MVDFKVSVSTAHTFLVAQASCPTGWYKWDLHTKGSKKMTGAWKGRKGRKERKKTEFSSAKQGHSKKAAIGKVGRGLLPNTKSSVVW